MKERMAVILAAGKGTRMRSKLYKVMHPILGLPMIEYVMRAVENSGAHQIITVVGHGAETIQSALGERSEYVLQEEQLGTGHAVLQTEPLLANKSGHTLVIYGDTPLLTNETLDAFFKHHESVGAQASVLTAEVDNPYGYGRIVRHPETGYVDYIVEEKDANPSEQAVKEINSGIYILDNQWLFKMLAKVTNDNAQGEYYLPDVIGLLNDAGQTVSAFKLSNPDEVYGINDRVALAKATSIMQQRINHHHMTQGVTLVDPLSIYIEADVKIGSDVVIEPNVQLKGRTEIKEEVLIGSQSEISNSLIGTRSIIRQSVIESSIIEREVTIGPFAHLRPQSHIKDKVHIGNFVEVKNSTLGEKTRAGHLTYVGDADIGKDVNLGAGTVFVNFDGVNKHRSTVGNHAFIGCNTSIISPVTIEDQATIAAGSPITKSVSSKSLAVSRTPQKNIPNYYGRNKNK